MKPIAGYEGLYSITEDGEVWSQPREWICGKLTRRHNGRLIKSKKVPNGYHRVGLCKDGFQKLYSVHRLLASAFIPNPDGKEEVNHKNGIKSDNRLCNLEWVSKSENSKHSWDTGLTKFTEKMRTAVRKNAAIAREANRKLSVQDVLEIKSEYKLGVSSQRQIAEKFKVSQATISNLMLRKYYGECK